MFLLQRFFIYVNSTRMCVVMIFYRMSFIILTVKYYNGLELSNCPYSYLSRIL